MSQMEIDWVTAKDNGEPNSYTFFKIEFWSKKTESWEQFGGVVELLDPRTKKWIKGRREDGEKIRIVRIMMVAEAVKSDEYPFI